MKAVARVFAGLALIALVAGCATQEDAPEATEAEETSEAQPAQEAPAELAQPGIAEFVAADGTTFESETIVTLPTGGPPAGRLVPTSSRDDVTLYVTRDGSVPSADNNWEGPIDPADPPAISRPLEGVASYRVIAAQDDQYSDPFTLTVIWEHQEDPDLARPTFVVAGREVSGSVSIPVSNNDDPAAQLRISCDYAAADLYITRDGSEPSVDNYWKTQKCEGTYLWSPEPTTAEYRVVAVWQGVRSPVASLSVEWVE
ncbi:MAG: hypothetical protein ACOC2Y_04790 [Spirochaetota bacterium]